jgi:hypothetical protein
MHVYAHSGEQSRQRGSVADVEVEVSEQNVSGLTSSTSPCQWQRIVAMDKISVYPQPTLVFVQPGRLSSTARRYDPAHHSNRRYTHPKFWI